MPHARHREASSLLPNVERDWSKKGYGRKTAGIPPRCILLDAYVLPVYTFKIVVRS